MPDDNSTWTLVEQSPLDPQTYALMGLLIPIFEWNKFQRGVAIELDYDFIIHIFLVSSIL